MLKYCLKDGLKHSTIQPVWSGRISKRLGAGALKYSKPVLYVDAHIKTFGAKCWNNLSLYDMKAYIKTFGLSAEIFSACIIWKYIKTFGGSGIILSLCHLEVYQNFRGWGAEIFSACVISKYIKTFRAGVLKYSQPVSSGSISKHLGWVLKYS